MIARRIAALAAALVLLAFMTGCASTPREVVNPALFARSAHAPGSRTPCRVAVLVPVQLLGQIYKSDRFDITDVRLPIRRVVDQAILIALGDALRDELQQVSAVPPAGSGFGATLLVDAIRFEYHDKWLWIVPLPPPAFAIGEREASSQLALDLSLPDAQGQAVWTRTYDARREIWHRPANSAETPADGLVRLAHEAAWRLARRAENDVAEWLKAERMKAREL